VLSFEAFLSKLYILCLGFLKNITDLSHLIVLDLITLKDYVSTGYETPCYILFSIYRFWDWRSLSLPSVIVEKGTA
jgi:hypothetical protein